MKLHANAKLGLAGRRELVLAIEAGMTLKQAAACFSVSPATAHRWWHRWLEGGRSSLALADRSSRPRHQPRRLSPAEEEPILRARRETNLGPGRRGGRGATRSFGGEPTATTSDAVPVRRSLPSSTSPACSKRASAPRTPSASTGSVASWNSSVSAPAVAGSSSSADHGRSFLSGLRVQQLPTAIASETHMHQGAKMGQSCCMLSACHVAGSGIERRNSSATRRRRSAQTTVGWSSARRRGSKGSPTPDARRQRRSASVPRRSTGGSSRSSRR